MDGPPQAKIPQLRATGIHPMPTGEDHKADIFEGGHRGPFVVDAGPPRLRRGTKSNSLVSTVDFLQLLLEITGTLHYAK